MLVALLGRVSTSRRSRKNSKVEKGHFGERITTVRRALYWEQLNRFLCF